MDFIKILKEKSEIILSVSVVGVLGIMILPIPPFLLDVFLSISIALSVVILVTSIYLKRPLDFSVFPTLLLITTLYRLSLNIATTRLILLKGHEGVDAAGQVIMSFGNFVVGGQYAVGTVIFIILVVVNFMVITKGSGRIAEVAARFTLDAMPGKQMAIDADLNAGMINEQEARRRREQITQEADFYGAMDGASKFVRGDAIAGIMITVINVIGGLVIGVLQKNMDIGDAAKTYTILTIGDGLVSQIPALLISTAAGIVVSRAGKSSDMGKDLTEQILINPKAMFTTSGILFALAIVPGLPHVAFISISAVMTALGYVLTMAARETAAAEAVPEAPAEEPRIESYIELDPLTLEIGYGLIPLVEEQRGELLTKIKTMRRQLAKEIGFIVPPIHIRDNLQLRPHEYGFLLRGVEVAKSEVMMGYWMAVASEESDSIEGIPTREPAFGLPAHWIEERNVEAAQAAGFMVVDTATVIATHLTELIRRHCYELLTRSEVQNMLDSVAKAYPKIVDELMPTLLTLGQVQRVLQYLLKERVPINDMVTILETLVDYAVTSKDIEQLGEHVRQSLARHITKLYALQDGSIPVFTLDPRFETHIAKSVQSGEAVSPDYVTRLIRGIEKLVDKDGMRGAQPIIVCSSQIRRFLKKIMERFMPSVVVLSNAEIAPPVRLSSMGMVKYED